MRDLNALIGDSERGKLKQKAFLVAAVHGGTSSGAAYLVELESLPCYSNSTFFCCYQKDW
jgi:hypothetical protein